MAIRKEDLSDGRRATVYAFPRGRARPARRAAIRRRWASLLAGAALIVALVGLATGPSGNAAASRSGAPRTVVLQSGQTLWELAERYAPESVDPRAYVDAVVELNALTGAPVTGQRLRLPR